MAEKLGLEAVFEMAGFAAGIQAYEAGIARATGSTGTFVDASGRLHDATGKYVRAANDASGASGNFAGAAERAGHSASGLSGALGNAAGALSHMAQNAISFAAGGLLTRGLDAIGSAVSGISQAMIGGNAEFERYEVQFGVLLGSTDAAKARLEELAKVGASTPFELPELVKADKILQAFGLHSADTAKKFGMSGAEIRLVAGDVASGTGASFEEIATYLGKFASGSTGEAISRMQELGIVTRSELKDMGLEFSKSGELLSPLDQSMTVLLGAMKEKFGGMMNAQSQTFEGMVSNLQDWLGQTGRALGKPIFDTLKTSLGGVLTFLTSSEVQAGIAGFAQTMAGGIGQGIEMAKTAIESLRPVVESVMDIIKVLGTGDITRVFTVFEDGSGFFSDFLQTLGLGEETATAVSLAIGRIVTALQFFSGILTGAEWDATMGGLFTRMNQVFGPDATALVYNFAGILRDTFTAIGQILSGDLMAGLETFAGGLLERFGLVEEDTTAVGDAFAMAKEVINTALQDTLATVSQVFTSITSLIQPVVDFLQAYVGVAFQTLSSIVMEHGQAILTNLTTAWTAVQGIVGPAVEAVAAVVRTVLGAVTEFLTAHGAEIASVIGTAWEKISSIISGVMQIIQTVVVPIFTAIAGFITQNQDGIKATIELVWGAVRLIVETALTVISGIVNTALAILKGDWEGAWNSVKAMVEGVWNSIVTFFSGVPGQMLDMGKRAIDGLIAGINAQAGAVLAALGNIVQSAIDAVKASLGIHSPSTVFSNFGELAMAGLARGFWAGADGAEGALEAIMDTLKAAASEDIFNRMKGEALGGILGNTATARGARAASLNGMHDQLAAGNLSDLALARGGEVFNASSDLIGQLISMADRVANMTYSPAGQGGGGGGGGVTINQYFYGPQSAGAVESGTMGALRRAGLVVAN